MKKYGVEFACIFSFTAIFGFATNSYAETIIYAGEAFINEDRTWAASGNPYLVNENVVITPGYTLTIEGGTEIRVSNGKKFDVSGNINILGTEDSKVYITAQGDDGSENPFPTQGGRWSGFVFNPGSKGNINYLDSRYTGYSPWPPPGGPMVYNLGGEVVVKNSKLYKSFSSAFYSKAGTTTVENALIDKNAIGVDFEGGYLSLVGSTISDSAGQGFGARITDLPGKIFLRDNILSNNKDSAYFDLNLDFDIASTTFIGEDFNAWTTSADLHTKKVLPASLSPYVIYGITISPGGDLTIEPGTILKGVQNGSRIINKGGLLSINGTKDNPVVFTTITDDTAGGDTNNDGSATSPDVLTNGGVLTEDGGNTKISHLFLNHSAGIDVIPGSPVIYGALINIGGTLTADNVHITDARNVGINHYSGVTNITDSSLGEHMDKSVAYHSGELNIHNSSLAPTYTNYSLYNDANLGVPNVQNNWWGTVEGPYHPTQNQSGTASLIQGDASFIPFLTSWPPVEEHKINPVIIVPGIMGSAKKNGQWVIDPILHTYDDLIATLETNGYQKEKNLFTFPYEWRDSNVITANLLKDKISAVKSACQSAEANGEILDTLGSSDCSKVDIVAHSMGGLVAREYVQSGQYQDDVDQLIFLGTPHKGSPKAYLQWEAGEFPPGFSESVQKQIFSIEALENGYLSLFNYIHGRPILSVQELLPAFDYLKDKETGILRTYPDNYPRNMFLEYLNGGVADLLNSEVDITNIVGNAGAESTIEKIRVVAGSNPLWINGKPDGFDGETADRGLERGGGDGTVTSYSSTLDASVPNEEFDQVSHFRLPRNTSSRIFNILTEKLVGDVIFVSLVEKIFSIHLQSPIDVLVTAPDGKRMGKNFVTGEEYNEIPGAFYSGYQNGDEEYITIPNPSDGDYKIKVQGTGNGGKYGVVTSYISEDVSVTSEATGIIKPNQITELGAAVDNKNPENFKAERKITLEVFLSDINGAYDLGWIKDTKTRDALVKQVKLAVKFEKKRNGKYETKVDKIILKLFEKELDLLLKKNKITQQAFDLFMADAKYLLENN